MLDASLQVGSVMDAFNKRLWQISNLIKAEGESVECSVADAVGRLNLQ
jgi:hypothetical protein